MNTFILQLSLNSVISVSYHFSHAASGSGEADP